MEGRVMWKSGRDGRFEDPRRASETLPVDASLHNFVALTGHWARRPAQKRTAAAAGIEFASNRPPTGGPTAHPVCVFCNRLAGTVGYAWPEWLGRFLTDHVIRSGKDHALDETILQRTRTEVDLTVRDVCAPCSQGWMQRLDDKVRPFFESMIVGNPTPLSQKRKELLAGWAATTAIVLEYADHSPVRTPPLACEHLRTKGIHPGTQVLVGSYDGDQILTHERDIFSRRVDSKKHYATQTSMVIGKAFIQVFADPWRNTTPEPTEHDTRHLVPLLATQNRKIEWPPPIPIFDADDDQIRHGTICDHDPSAQLEHAVPS